jgi:catechol 2,3-dioxygenase-like lactoylglutathione lyase family enzyme
MSLTGFAELTLEAHDVERLERFYTEAFGLEVLSREGDRVWLAAARRLRARSGGAPGRRPLDLRRGPGGHVVEVWDFFERGEGARDGTEAFKD